MPTLSDKITSTQALEEVTSFSERRAAIRNVGQGECVPFWAIREQLRIDSDIYTVTSALARLNRVFPVFGHISQRDKTMVAYTPDKAAAEADRQIITTPGRLFSKYMPLLSDRAVAELLAEHEAEATAEITWVTGMEIVKAYQELGSVGACMSGAKFEGFKHHPTEVYDAENVRLALLKDKTGKVVARSLVYEPSPEDKRYIRIYGSPTIRQLLKREGYKVGSFAGAKLKLLPVPETEGEYYVPYIDSNGGYATSLGSTVVVVNGQLQVLDRSLRDMLIAEGVTTREASASSGIMRVPDASDKLKFQCVLTGHTYSILDTKFRVAFHNGVLGKVNENLAQGSSHDTCLPTWAYAKYKDNRVLALESETVEIEGKVYVNCEENMNYMGFRKLSSLFYENVWSANARLTEDGYIESDEAITVYLSDSAADYVVKHKSKVLKTYCMVSPVKGTKAYAINKSIVSRTSTGKKVLKGVHEVVADINGDLQFSKYCLSVSIAGEMHYVLKKAEPSESLKTPAISKVRDKLAGKTLLELLRMTSRGMSGYSSVYYSSSVKIADGVYGGYSDYRYLENILGMNKVTAYLSIFGAVVRSGGNPYSRLELALIKAEFNARLAEMYAVEAPHYLVDMPVEVEQASQINSNPTLPIFQVTSNPTTYVVTA